MSSSIYIFSNNVNKHLYKFSFVDIVDEKIFNKISSFNNLIFLINSKRKKSNCRFFVKIKKFNYKNIFSNNKTNDFMKNVLCNNTKKNVIDFFSKTNIEFIKQCFNLLDINFDNNKDNINFFLNFKGGGVSSMLDNFLYSFIKFSIFIRNNFFFHKKIINKDDNYIKYFSFLVNKDKLNEYHKKRKSDYNSLYDSKKIILINKYIKEDVRKSERKKVGKSSARRSEQFSKR
jgi:hypothetical protein